MTIETPHGDVADVQPGDFADLAKPSEDMPLPTDLRTLVPLGIFVVLCFYTMYFTREILIPIFFAFVLNLLLQPIMRFLTRLHVPRAIAALLMILIFFGVVGGVGASIASPAAEWIAKAPESMTRLEQRLYFLREPLVQLQTRRSELKSSLRAVGRKSVLP